MISHPLENLHFEDGDLWEIIPGPPTRRNKYMVSPPIKIIEKVGVQEFRNHWRYQFRTNHRMDLNWGFLLRHQLPLTSYVTWVPVTDLLILECSPKNLNAEYAILKKAIEETNSAYAAERRRLIKEIQAAEKRQGADKKAEASRNAAAKKEFDSLEL